MTAHQQPSSTADGLVQLLTAPPGCSPSYYADANLHFLAMQHAHPCCFQSPSRPCTALHSNHHPTVSHKHACSPHYTHMTNTRRFPAASAGACSSTGSVSGSVCRRRSTPGQQTRSKGGSAAGQHWSPTAPQVQQAGSRGSCTQTGRDSRGRWVLCVHICSC
jgi:hypothetical protein